MYTQPVNSLNKSTQILIKETCAGITLYPATGSSQVDFDVFVQKATVRVELVRKSQPNSVLYTMPMKELFVIWGGFNKSPKGAVIPFSLKDNLLLSKDSYLQIDISWVGLTGGEIDSLKVQKNTLATSTNAPISFKKIELDGEMEIDTEHFGYVFIPDTVEKIETFVDVKIKEFTKESSLARGSESLGRNVATNSLKNDLAQKSTVNTGDCCCDGQVKIQKVEMDYAYMSYMSTLPTEENVLFATEPNQVIKFFGSGTVTLMQS